MIAMPTYGPTAPAAPQGDTDDMKTLKTLAAALVATASLTATPAGVNAAPAWIDKAVKDGKRCRRYEPLFKAHGLPVTEFTYIAWRESRCRPGAINARFDKHGRIVWTLNRNGTFDSGLLQINSGWRTVTRNVCGTDLTGLMRPDCNVAVAAYLFANGGLRHWGLQGGESK